MRKTIIKWIHEWNLDVLGTLVAMWGALVKHTPSPISFWAWSGVLPAAWVIYTMDRWVDTHWRDHQQLREIHHHHERHGSVLGVGMIIASLFLCVWLYTQPKNLIVVGSLLLLVSFGTMMLGRFTQPWIVAIKNIGVASVFVTGLSLPILCRQPMTMPVMLMMVSYVIICGLNLTITDWLEGFSNRVMAIIYSLLICGVGSVWLIGRGDGFGGVLIGMAMLQWILLCFHPIKSPKIIAEWLLIGPLVGWSILSVL